MHWKGGSLDWPYGNTYLLALQTTSRRQVPCLPYYYSRSNWWGSRRYSQWKCVFWVFIMTTTMKKMKTGRPQQGNSTGYSGILGESMLGMVFYSRAWKPTFCVCFLVWAGSNRSDFWFISIPIVCSALAWQLWFSNCRSSCLSTCNLSSIDTFVLFASCTDICVITVVMDAYQRGSNPLAFTVHACCLILFHSFVPCFALFIIMVHLSFFSLLFFSL